MRTNIIYLLTLLLFIIAACGKDDPVSIPEPQPELVKKYLKKVLYARTDSTFSEVVHCTWDSLHRLKTYSSRTPRLYNYAFQYDSIGRVSRINYNDGSSFSHDNYYALCDWKNEKELNCIDLYAEDYLDSTIFHHRFQHNYSYDQLGRIIKIESSTSWIYQIEWEGSNITRAGGLVGNQKFDKKHSPWSVFPDMLILVFTMYEMNLVYYPSKNSPIQGGGFFHSGDYSTQKFEYDYDKDGYPLRQYYLQEDETKLLMYVFEYYE